jgi:diaminopimelate epimerase
VRADGLLAQLAIHACNPHFGIGGDGLLVAGMEDGDLRLRMFNPDGTEDFCGNGMRCAAVHAFNQGWVGGRFVIRHLDRRVEVDILGSGAVRMVIGVADYAPQHVPVRTDDELFDAEVWQGNVDGQAKSYRGSSLTTGSTHTVIWGADPDEAEFNLASPQIEVDPKFPHRTSILWAKELAHDHLEVRIWERGVGETAGCGTGSSATVVDYLRRQGRGGKVSVENPGGTVLVSLERWDGPITIEGVAEEVYRGEFLFRPQG